MGVEFLAGLVGGFIIGGEFTRAWMRGKILKNHPHPDTADLALAEAQQREKEILEYKEDDDEY